MQASERTQVVVTTHSRMLVDALTDHPSSVVVCEKENGESRFERLDGTRLKAWLDRMPARPVAVGLPANHLKLGVCAVVRYDCEEAWLGA